MKENNYKSIIESMLFVWGEPLSIKKIADIIELSFGETKEMINELKDDYEKRASGIQIIEVNNSIQFGTLKDNHAYIEKLCKRSRSKGLSQSAVEVMTIVAYKQPLTRADIEMIRGVSCDRPIRILVEKELIEEKGRLEKIGRPVLYGTTDVFLKCFGFKTIKDLPKIENFEQLNLFIEKENAASAQVEDVFDVG